MKSPTARSLELLREDGYLAEVTEKWLPIPGKKIRVDLFGFIDILAIHRRSGEVLAVQSTDRTSVSKRLIKISEEPRASDVLLAKWKIVVHGWGKMASGNWECRVVDYLEWILHR